MARAQTTNNAFDYKAFRSQAAATLAQLRKDIRVGEKELEELRQQERQLSVLLGGTVGATGAHDTPRTAGGRTDWTSVLKKLPKEFKAADVRKHVGNKRASEIFAAVTRWQENKLVKRKDRGVYQRVD